MTSPIQVGGWDTFEKVVQKVADTLGRSDLLGEIPDWITLVEKEMARDIPLRDSEFVEQFAFNDDNEEFIDLPINLLQLRHMRIDTNSPYSIDIVGIVKLNDIRTNGSGGSLPFAGAHVGNRLYLAPTPKTDDKYTLTYRGTPVLLSHENPSNRILQDAPDLVYYGALLHSAPFIGDDARVQLWAGFYDRAKTSYKMLEHRNRTGGGPLRVRPDTSPLDQHSFRGGSRT